MAANFDEAENENESEGEQKVDEELDDLEQRQIPDEGQVHNAMTEVKHKLEISQQLFKIAGSMKHRKLVYNSR